jgi:hypothetical protein
MPTSDVSSDLEELRARLNELERRLSALEGRSPTHAAGEEAPPPVVTPASSAARATQSQPSSSSVFGKAVLGIAGAYLLRAAAESGSFPPWIATTFALLYAAGWLAWAAWPETHGLLARYSYALTAALIFSSLLWEVTVRFQMLRPPVTAAVLVAFAALTLALAVRYAVSPVRWVGMLASVLTALLLMVATRALVPFTSALLAIALLTEFAALRGRWPILRAIVAAGTDFAALVLIIILGNPKAIAQDYHSIPARVMIVIAAALFCTYAAPIAIRSLVFRSRVKSFEAFQLTTAALLAGWAVLRITQGTGLRALGVCCLILGAACYYASFGLLARHRERPNFFFYATWAAAFVVSGSFFVFPSLPLVIWLCCAAAATIGLGVYARSPALEVHGIVYLSAALWASGLFLYAGRALAGAYPSAPGALSIVAAAATVLCAGVVSRYPGEHPAERLLRLLPAILAVYAMAGLVVVALVWSITQGAPPSLLQLAFVRTVVTCAAALLLAFLGARRKQLELVWMAYAAAVLGSLKLVFEDLRVGSTRSLAASLLVYGAVLILIPRLVRAQKRRT